MDYLFGVSFNNQGKPQFFLANYEIKLNDSVVCETLKGIELGKVVTNPKEYVVNEEDNPFTYIIRLANEEDLALYQKNLKEAQNALKIVQNQADKLSLDMKVTTSEYTLDQSKLTISYLSEDRVDFRELLKILASIYRCRIELRQIGPRDKAKIIGGIGICGLPLCCSTFLNEFDGISITMAKNQMLALNIPKLSGHCGKLICCLKYEDEVYTLEKQNLPKVGLRVNYNDQVYRISSINILNKMVRLENPDSIVIVPLSAIENKIITNYNPNQQMKRSNDIKKKKKEKKDEEN